MPEIQPEDTDIAQAVGQEMSAEAEALEPRAPGRSSLDWRGYPKIKEARIVSEQGLKSGACDCFEHDGKKLCFSDAAIGILSDDQVGMCGSTKNEPMPDEVAQLMQAAEACVEDPDWAGCIAKQMPGQVSEP